MRRGHRGSEHGYSLVELTAAVGLLGILAAIAVTQVIATGPAVRGDGAMRVLIGQLGIARDTAISERRDIRILFEEPRTISLVRSEVPEGTTVLSEIPLESGVIFGVVGGLPDTPDAFGQTAAIDFGDAEAIFFTTDGSLIDENGEPINGTVFLTAGDWQSARAVTVFGSTGRIRGYRWDGRQWVLR